MESSSPAEYFPIHLLRSRRSKSCAQRGGRIPQVAGMFVVPRAPLPAALSGMAKARVRKPDGRKTKAPAADASAQDDGSVLPPRKPPAPSAKQRWRRAKGAEAEVISPQ
jgi:hypothetical protein